MKLTESGVGRAALFGPCVAMAASSILLSFANPAPTWGLWMIRHAFTLAAGIGAFLSWPFAPESPR